MKLTNIAIIFLILISSAFATELKTNKDSTSYALGIVMGRNLSGSPMRTELDIEILTQSIIDTFNGEEKFSEEEKDRLLDAFQVMAQAKQADLKMKNIELSEAQQKEFLEKNKKRSGVITTKSGLQYEVIKKGNGRKPKASETVKVNYKGSLINSKVFESSYSSGKPKELILDQIIDGFSEGLQLMSEGAEYVLFIPSELGYGEKGNVGSVPGSSTLVIEVELVEVK